MKLVPKRKMLNIQPDQMLDIIQNIYNTASSVMTGDSAGATTQTSGIVFIVDGGGFEITTGVKGYISLPFACEIVAGELEADTTGSIQIDVWADRIGNFPPTDVDSITASAPLAISGALTDFDPVLTGWTTALTRFTILAFNVDSCNTITKCTITLHVKRL